MAKVAKQFEIEVTMDSGQVFYFLVSHSQVCRDGRARKYLEERVARKRAKERKIPGCVRKVTNLTLKMRRSQSTTPNPWYS